VQLRKAACLYFNVFIRIHENFNLYSESDQSAKVEQFSTQQSFLAQNLYLLLVNEKLE
jgi:hypothetical protein